MTAATVGASTETSTYDGDGVRFSRQVDAGPVTRYVTDLASSLPVTIDDGSRKYVWGIGLAYAVSGSAIEVYHTDRLGSVRAITDASGTVTATYRTDEFGIETASTGTSTQPYGFTGEPQDASGLSYLRARYYDPVLGRFTSRDTWPGTTAQPATLHRYAYAGNNPLTTTDPSGRCWPLCFAAVGAAIGGAIGGLAYTAMNLDSWDAGGFAGSVAGGAIAGAATAVAGPLGGSIGLAVSGSATGVTAIATTAAIGAVGGAAATQVNSLISTGRMASLPDTLQGALLNGAGGVIANALFPMRGVLTAAQAGFFGPGSLATLLGRGINATAFQRAGIASSLFGVSQSLFPWSWSSSGSRVKRAR